MRPGHPTRLATLMLLLLAACGPGLAGPGWRGADVHLVNGVWIGTETACSDDDHDLECRTVVARAMALLAPETRTKVVKAALAALPTTFLTASGEERTARSGGGITTREAVVLDLVDGTRRVIGLSCHLPYAANNGGLLVRDVTCAMNPYALDDWRDGKVPPSLPPDANFG